MEGKLKPVKAESKQRAIFEKLYSKMRPQFSDRKSRKHADDLIEFKTSPEYRSYALSFKRGAYLGLNLKGPSLEGDGTQSVVLEFTTLTPKGGRPAALLAKDEAGETYLFHDGRITNRDDRAGPYSHIIVEIEGHTYYLVGNIFDPEFFPNLVEFHKSRLDPEMDEGLRPAPEGEGRAGFDPGYSGEYDRYSRVSAGTHYAIADALYKECVDKEWLPKKPGGVRPDLFVGRSGRKVLFEVKPDSSSSSMMMAVGQLLTYNQELKADRLFIVAPTKDERALAYEGLSAAIQKTMIEANIHRIVAVQVGRAWKFPTLDASLAFDSQVKKPRLKA